MQGFNMGRYVPPDREGVISGNALHRKHPLGARASRLASDGSLTVRFEMPFAIWCSTCPQPTLIAQGVRFNAAKRRAGAYHSTPVWAFRMRHPACGGEIEIRTDPANSQYVVTAGATRRDTGEARHEGDSLVGDDGGFAIMTENERAAARESAFAKLERTIADRDGGRVQLAEAAERIGGLEGVAARQWDDPFARNQALRRAFRVGRKAREKEAATTGELADRMSLGIELVAASEEDARRAAGVDFGSAAADPDGEEPIRKVLAQPLFAAGDASAASSSSSGKRGMPSAMADKNSEQKAASRPKPKSRPERKLKSEIAAAKTRESLVSEIVGNTRLVMDPFLDLGAKEASRTTPSRLPGVKRKRAAEEVPDPPPVPPETLGPDKLPPSGGPALVSYDSESD